MNKPERIELLRAMDLLARSCNNEHHIDYWLAVGIADGDAESDEELAYYAEDDERFSETMSSFLKTMWLAYLKGGLYCDGVTDDPKITIELDVKPPSLEEISNAANFISQRFNKVT